MRRNLKFMFGMMIFTIFRYFPNYIGGSWIRRKAFRAACRKCGRNLKVGYGVTVRYLDKVTIGDNVMISNYAHIDGYGGVVIGDNVRISHNASILSSKHDYMMMPLLTNKYDKLGPVIIGECTWIGCGSVVMPKINIGERCVVGSNAVVTHDIRNGVLAAGVPARVKKELCYGN